MYRIEDFQKKPAFSSFLPGIAGFRGIPMWAFYCNRGQGITSFGWGDKDGAILEFQPAVKAYSLVHTQGFRTFLRVEAPTSQSFEPFEYCSGDSEFTVQQSMLINEDRVSFVETRQGFEITVTYSSLFGQPLGALVRTLEIKNTSAQGVEVEFLDGLSRLVPFGSNDDGIKNIANTLTGWMLAETFEGKGLYSRMSSTFADSTEVREQRGGNWVLSFVEGESQVLPLIYDPSLVFGSDTSFGAPSWFMEKGLAGLSARPQVAVGRFPCAFSGGKRRLEPSESFVVTTFIGTAGERESVVQIQETILEPNFTEKNRQAGANFLTQLLAPGLVRSGSREFDAYLSQTYLDNLLRGGYPWIMKTLDGEIPYHLFGRKHGDMERDYNRFSLRPEYYSRGPGNFRDVFQNRRTEIWYEPRVGTWDIREFMNLIQADGYNPLLVTGLAIEVPGLEGSRTLGSLTATKRSEPLETIIAQSRVKSTAEFGEGYWVDHWTYGQDLIDEYLRLYPDRAKDLYFDDRGYTFYSNDAHVLPRNRRYVEDAGAVYQYKSIEEIEHLPQTKEEREHGSLRYTLFEKLLVLAAVKYTTLDAQGIGIEMEAGKPGWYDALNGLPAQFGSSTSELAELYRLVKELKDRWTALSVAVRPESIQLPIPAVALLKETHQLWTAYRSEGKSRFWYWDGMNSLREHYRHELYAKREHGQHALEVSELEQWLEAVFEDLSEALQRWQDSSTELPPTYYRAQAKSWTASKNAQGTPEVQVHDLEYSALPLFLEGVVKFVKVFPELAQDIRNRVRSSNLFDQKLSMYKVNESLAHLPLQIGRTRAFPPGWLENESIWLHMEYKFLLEILKAGRADLFWEDARTCMPPFMDEATYGRSILENSSFIVSSAHPDPELWGRGFVARLSGSTAEFLSMIQLALWGLHPFGYEDGELSLGFVPLLPGWLFLDDGSIEATFLGSTRVRFLNPQKRNLFGDQHPREYLVTWRDSQSSVSQIEGSLIRGRVAEQIREQKASHIEVRF